MFLLSLKELPQSEKPQEAQRRRKKSHNDVLLVVDVFTGKAGLPSYEKMTMALIDTGVIK